MAGSHTRIICIDDIERRGEKLAARDVLGLISNLKEHKRCKVVLILNDDAIAKDKDKADFDNYSEKVIDISLKFAPSAEECVRIALKPDTETVELLGKHCVTLGISNIRVIKKIERSVISVEPLLKGYENEVLKQAVQTLVLLGWSVLEPNKAPALEYLKGRKPNYLGGQERKAPTESEAAWNALLDNYEFTSMDEFDLALLDGLRDGYFDSELVRRLAGDADQKIKTAKSNISYRKAWDLFHYSFENNGDEVANTIYKAFLDNVNLIDPMNMNSIVELLKGLGRTEQASEVVDSYVTQRGDNKALFDIGNNVFGDHITDPDVIKALNDKFKTFNDDRDPATVLLSMSGGWNREDVVSLSSMNADDYYKLFKSATGERLRKIIANCLQFSRISNASEPEREIVKRAREALTKIGQESAINAIRVEKYGIIVNEANQADTR